MVSYVVLDEKIANAFTPLFQGDINIYTDDFHMGYGAVKDGEPVGLFLASVYPEMVSMDWIYVKEGFRGEELGRRMTKGGVRVLIDILGAQGVNVCCTDDKLKVFLERCGFIFETSKCQSYRGKLSDLKVLPETKIRDNTVFTLSELTPRDYKGMNLYFSSLKDTELTVEMPIDKDSYMNVPSVYIRKDRIRATLLLKEDSETEVSISFAYAFGHDGKALATLINAARKEVSEKLGDDVYVSTASVGEHTEKMLEALFSLVEKQPIYIGWYPE